MSSHALTPDDLYAAVREVNQDRIVRDFTYEAPDEASAQRARALGIPAEVAPKIQDEPPMRRVPNRAMRRKRAKR